jgi:hypothetical protein
MTEHCETCGTTDRESLTTGDQGYTACCNEPICRCAATDSAVNQCMARRAGTVR